ncbi:MAG: hypothetical protein K6T90_16420 [Leptolyngbyaceae cyanobacterium HOT.MB2.61]|jgi:hypothetical protein|nr:hypothetical protein [Leptolyngbyaceae cyanobacterium HOT.MB2.61]
MAVERWTDEMLDQLAATVRETTVLARTSAEAIAANSQAIAANSQAIADLRVLVSDLREGQAILTQILVEEREARQEFRRATNAALDRIDRALEELRRDRENGN